MSEPGTTGATFKGHNRFRDDLWTTERDNSVWSFDIEPDGDGCTLTQRFRMKQPPSQLLSIRDSLPADRAATFLEFRRADRRRDPGRPPTLTSTEVDISRLST
ncbi:hypothetical protein [Saccharopolyspora pogona]|uniref:hypothetical protein n=1 Tax=Saccharopolyspora pogona TaxID=333966 RepID=UPI0016829392|nr:hypothetical protein [Saccharopolyspora pogona]